MTRLHLNHCPTCTCVEDHPLHPVRLGTFHGRRMRNPPETTRLMVSAGLRVRAAIKRGDLVRPEACTCCGRSDQRIEAAHFDYRRPMDVAWLCRRCHRLWDNVVVKWRNLPTERGLAAD